MARFNFRFETMLKLRRQREDEQKRIVAARLRQITQVKQELSTLEGQIQEQTDALRAGQAPGVIDIQAAIRYRHYIGRLHRSVLDAQGRLGTLEAHLAQERAALAEAAKQRRILEKLRERQWDRFRHEQDRRLTLAADDLASIRFVFTNAEETSAP